MQNHKTVPLPELVEKLMSHLEGKGFTPSTRNRLEAYYNVFLKYAKKWDIPYFSLEIGKTFLLQHHKHQWTETGKLSIEQNFLQKHIIRLHEFQEYGEIVSKKRLKRVYFIPHFETVLNNYLEHERLRGLKESTLAGKRHVLNQIFEYFESLGLKSTHDVRAVHIFSFFETHTYFSVTTKEHYQYVFRSLIRYLYNNGVCQSELLKLFEVISIHTKNAYPSYFKPGDICKILQCVDVNTPGGKRDYLVLLLAAELGMRVSDICALKIDNVDVRRKRVEYVQAKTGDMVSLPISDELLCAFADYLKNARPNCSFAEVLINGKAPREPFRNKTFHGMLQKYLVTANIEIPVGQKHGLHALRSSLASNMLRDGASIPIISNVLGHRYADTTSMYLKIDLDGLRKSALEVPAL